MEKHTSKNIIKKIENDPTTSTWLKANLRLLDEERDVVDVLNELDLMQIIFKLKFKELQKKS